jgi:hypothetical protein
MLPSLLEFLGGSVLVGHNLRFDLSFIDHALVSTGRDRLANATVDTLALARRLVRDVVPNCKLGTLAANLRLCHQPSHRALEDVLATGDLLHAMLERAGSFGILGLEELLDLPRLVGHPQAAKLRLTTRLPHRPGVYWFTDAAGHVLHVGRATDLRARVRSYFSGERRPKIGRLLRQLHAVHYQVCSGSLTAVVMEERLQRAWSPAFDRQRNVRRKDLVTATRSGALQPTAKPVRPRRRRRRWSVDQLADELSHLLGVLGAELSELSREQRYEEAAWLRDEADELRHLLARHRLEESLRAAGRVALLIDGEESVTLDDGMLVDGGGTYNRIPLDPVPTGALGVGHGDDHRAERAIVAQWLIANADRVRILEVASPLGLSLPADRIPRLSELCGAVPGRVEADPGPSELHAPTC